MWPFPKQHFEWWEPREFRRSLKAWEASKTRWWTKPLAGCVKSRTFLAIWAMAKLAGSEQAPSLGVAVLISLPGGLFLVYFPSWVYRILPSSVMITDDRVLRIVGNSAREWKFANVQSFALMEWPESRVLAILLGDGSEPLIGVAPHLNLSALETFLSRRGLKQTLSNRRHSVSEPMGRA